MKLFETQIRSLLCLALLVSFLAANTACSAQDKTKPKSNPQQGDPASEDKAAEVDKFLEQKIDIEFQESLSVEDFVAYLRDKTDDRVNIVVAKDARKVMIPSLELRQVSIVAALNAMHVATQEEVGWNNGPGEFIRIFRDPNRADPLFNKSATSVRVFNVSKIVDQNEKAEASMLSAIEIGLEMSSSSPENVNMKFHKETKLLFIRASGTDVDTVMQVLEQIGAGLTKPMDDVYGGYGG